MRWQVVGEVSGCGCEVAAVRWCEGPVVRWQLVRGHLVSQYSFLVRKYLPLMTTDAQMASVDVVGVGGESGDR